MASAEGDGRRRNGRDYPSNLPGPKRGPSIGFKPLRPHRIQRQLWTTDCRFVAVPAGRRSGKTEIATHRAIRKAIIPKPWDDVRIGFGAPVRQQAKRIFWKKLKSVIPLHWQYDVSESDLRIELANGSELWVLGLDAPERIEGIPWDMFVLDEYANMHPEVWMENVRPALADRQGEAMMIGVPEGRNHFWELCEDYKVRDDCEFFTWKSRDILPITEIEQLQRDLDPRTFRQEMEASFEEASGRIYYAFDREQDVHEFKLPPNIGTEANPWVGGMDFNVDPMTASWGWEEDRYDAEGRQEKHVFVWDEANIPSNANTEVTASLIIERCTHGRTNGDCNYPYNGSRFGKFILHPDPSGKSRKTSAPVGQTDHTILRARGFSVRSRASNPSLRDKYNSVNTMFESGDGRRRVHVHPRCKHLIRGLEGLLYKEGTNEPDKVKCKGMEHPTDTIGYWIEYRHRARYEVGRFNF